MSVRRNLIILVAVFCVALLFAFLRAKRREAVFYPMGGIPFKVVAYDRDYFEFRKDMTAVKDRVAALEHIFSRHNKQSELSSINRDAAEKAIPISAEMVEIILLSKKWQRETGGAFDPTVGPLMALWMEAGKGKFLPSAKDIEGARQYVGMDNVETKDSNVHFLKQGMSFDLGAIAKGAIVDAAAEILKTRGVLKGVIEAGGDALAFGEGFFKFGIADPKASNKVIGTVDIVAGGIVTSGDYQRFVEINGKKYSHIIDPRTGYPVQNDVVSATIIGGTAADADAIATAAIVLGFKELVSLFEKIKFAKGIFILQKQGEYEVLIPEDLKGNVHLLPEWSENVKYF